MEERNVMIICITIIIAVLIISGTFLLINSNNNNLLNRLDNENNDNSNSNSGNNENNGNSESNENTQTVDTNAITVKSVTFYSDGNPNTGETATINFGSENSGKTVNIKTFYSRDGTKQNSPSGYESHTIDSDGNIVVTDYTPMPKYPSNCVIEVNYNGITSSYECDIGTYKGTQTAIPRRI